MKRLPALCLGLSAALLLSCMGPRSGGIATERSNWWNVYGRGHQKLAQGDWQGAREDFERCLGRRPGVRFPYAHDHWRVRTYGMHQQTNYFPHRELAVALLNLDRPADAEPLLLRSLEQEPSERAKHFLNLARARLLEGAGLAAPAVRPDFARIHANQPEVRLTGEAEGLGRIATLGVQGIVEREALAENRLRFNRTLRLPAGKHEVEVRATDLLGQSGAARVEVIVDFTAPTIQLVPPKAEGPAWRLRGTIRDEQGLAEARIDGADLLPRNADLPTEIPFDILLAPGKTGRLLATDPAGNRMELLLGGEELPRWLQARESKLAAGPVPMPTAWKARLTLLGSNTLGRVSQDRVFLNGEAVDPDGVRSVRLNGQTLFADGPLAKPMVRFATWQPLVEGTNFLHLASENIHGVLREQRFEVVYAPARHTRLEYRMSATLPPFHIPRDTQTPPALEAKLRDAFLAGSPPYPARFQILSRGPEFEDLLREIQISRSELVDPRANIPFARLATSDLFLNGEILPDAGGVTLRLHTIQTAEGMWLASDDVYLDASEREVQGLLRGLASRVERRFPLGPGRIRRVHAGKVWLDLPEKTTVSLGGRFLVLQTDDPVGPGVLRQGERWVELLMADPDRAIARIHPPEGKNLVRPGDSIYTR
jgi:hypothetical protein